MLLSTNFLHSQNSNFYISFFGGASQDIGYDIIQSKDSNLIVVGSTGSFYSVQTDIYLARVNQALHAKWQKNIGGNQTDVGKSVVELKDSSIVIAGYTSSFGAGGYDAYFVKTNKNGDVIWEKTFGGKGWDFANSIICQNDSTLLICGYTTSFDHGKEDAFVLKMNTSGDILSYKIFGGPKDDIFKQIFKTADGGFMTIGTTNSYGDSLGDLWLTKFDAAGDSSWFKTYGRKFHDVGNSIEQDQNGDYLVVGGIDTVGNGKKDAYLLKLTPTGTIIWERFYGLPGGDEEAFKIKRPSSTYGSMMLCYSTNEVATFKTDAKALILDALGYYLNGGRVGSYGNEEVFSIAPCLDKGFALVGYTSSFEAQDQDIFLIKFDSLVNGTGSLVVNVPEKFGKAGALRVFPNPSNGALHILVENEGITHIEVKDLSGVIRYQRDESRTENCTVADLDLNSGVYILSVKTNIGSYTMKLICNIED